MKPRQRTQEAGRIPIAPIVDVQIGNYVIEKKKYMGKGQYGIVYSCYDIRNKERPLCAKQIAKKEVDPVLLKREIEILKLLRPLQQENENLVELVDVFEDKDKQYLYIIMEKCSQGDLKGLMEVREKKQKWFTVKEAVNIIKQVLKGYEALYKMKVIHRDIKPANILINNDVYKIADLGMGRILEDMAVLQDITKVGTPAYAAPQLFLEPMFSSKADVYSLGVIFYQLIYNELPICASSQAELIENLRNMKDHPISCTSQSALDEEVPENVKQIINSMLMYEETDRASWMDLFASPLFALNIAQPKRSNPKKFTLTNLRLNEYQEHYRIDYVSVNTKQDKLLHIIRVLITKSDLAAKAYKLLQEQKFLTNRIKFENESVAALQVCLSGYRYRTLQNALGLLINQPSTIIYELKQRFSQAELTDFSVNFQNDSVKLLKEYITKILNQSILQFREDECIFFSNLKKPENQDQKSLKALLEEEDNPNFIPYSTLFRRFYTSSIQYINWNKQDQKNKELIALFDKISDSDLNFSLDKIYTVKPTDILQKSTRL